MEMAPASFTEFDYAKYPFLKEASKHIEKLDLTIEKLVNPENTPILARAQNRLESAIREVNIGGLTQDYRTEISSFATAIILAIATKNSLIKKRYALAEAKTAHAQIISSKKPKETILAIARDFGWDIRQEKIKDFSLCFTYYLKNASHLHGYEWKLVNQILDSGRVYLNSDKTARLLQEEIKRRIEKRLAVAELKNLPEKMASIASELNKLAQETLGQEMEEFPKVVVQAAFPPCINALYADAAASHHLSHTGRFTLVTFLINIGMSPEALNELFKTFSDYNERLTRYQIEHLAGERGSGTRYTPPQCSVLQTHGVCKGRDDLCRRIYHPLKYYKLKQSSVKSG